VNQNEGSHGRPPAKSSSFKKSAGNGEVNGQVYCRVPNSAYRVRADCDNPEASGSAIFALTGGYLLMIDFDDNTN
jgi:hypothetical protein